MQFKSLQDIRQRFLVAIIGILSPIHLIALVLLFLPPQGRIDYIIFVFGICFLLFLSGFIYYKGYYKTPALLVCTLLNIELGFGFVNSFSQPIYIFLFLLGLTQVILISGMLLGTRSIAFVVIPQIILVIISSLTNSISLQLIFLFIAALVLASTIFTLYQQSLERALADNQQLLEQVQTQNEQLRKLNAEQERFLITLEEKVVERTAELQETIGELNTFSSTVAHDLKNPLGGIIGYGEMLHEELEGSAQAQEQAHLADRIVQIAFRMREIIDSLLLLARTRGAEVQTAPMAMYDVVQNACDRLSYVILHNEVQIHIAAEWPLALGNKAWVEEVWANYLSNAIKYGGKPAIIHVGGEILPETAEARFWVQDNGRGLTPAEQEKLFVPFSQLRQAKDSHGLGLAIVKRITTKLGGTVGVESTVGEGSRFYFTLPLAEELVRA